MGDSISDGQQNPAHRKPGKRKPLTAVACEACRKRKSKCDGLRPTCSACQSKDLLPCIYEAGVDGSRIQQLRKHNESLKHEVAALQIQLSELRAERDSVAMQPDQNTQALLQELSRSSPNRGGLTAKAVEQVAGPSQFDPGRQFHAMRDRTRHLRNKGELTNLSAKLASSSSSISQQQQMGNLKPSMPFIQPSTQSNDSPISRVYSSFREFARQALADGESESKVLGSFEINAGVLFSNSDLERGSFLSQWAGQVVSVWGLQTFAPKIGMMYMLFKLMRWQVSLSQTDFDDIPAIMKPTFTQMSVPHAPFIDFVVWPSLRDLFITESQVDLVIKWVGYITQSIDLAKDFTFDEVLYGEGFSGCLRVRESFRVFIEDIDHWTLDSKVADLIPNIKDKVRFR